MKALREPLWWLIALFIGLLVGLPLQRAAVQSAVPGAAAAGLSAGELLGANPRSRLAGGGVQSRGNGCGTGGQGVAVTRPAGSAFRPLVETIAAIGQTFPPVAVLAMAVPVLGFGWLPALIALALYGILPVLQGRWPGWGRYRRGVRGGRRDGNERLAASV